MGFKKNIIRLKQEGFTSKNNSKVDPTHHNQQRMNAKGQSFTWTNGLWRLKTNESTTNIHS